MTRNTERSILTHALRASALFASIAALGACVSVNVGPKPAGKSEGVQFRAPNAPFAKFNSKQADSAWQNKRNGNIISYLSTCNDPADPALEMVLRELTGTLDDPHTARSSAEPYNGREALRSEVSGLVDGVKTRIDVLVFKRNDCTYTLSYVGVDRAFAEDRARFQEFLDAFRAP